MKNLINNIIAIAVVMISYNTTSIAQFTCGTPNASIIQNNNFTGANAPICGNSSNYSIDPNFIEPLPKKPYTLIFIIWLTTKVQIQ